MQTNTSTYEQLLHDYRTIITRDTTTIQQTNPMLIKALKILNNQDIPTQPPNDNKTISLLLKIIGFSDFIDDCSINTIKRIVIDNQSENVIPALRLLHKFCDSFENNTFCGFLQNVFDIYITELKNIDLRVIENDSVKKIVTLLEICIKIKLKINCLDVYREILIKTCDYIISRKMKDLGILCCDVLFIVTELFNLEHEIEDYVSYCNESNLPDESIPLLHYTLHKYINNNPARVKKYFNCFFVRTRSIEAQLSGIEIAGSLLNEKVMNSQIKVRLVNEIEYLYTQYIEKNTTCYSEEINVDNYNGQKVKILGFEKNDDKCLSGYIKKGENGFYYDGEILVKLLSILNNVNKTYLAEQVVQNKKVMLSTKIIMVHLKTLDIIKYCNINRESVLNELEVGFTDYIKRLNNTNILNSKLSCVNIFSGHTEIIMKFCKKAILNYKDASNRKFVEKIIALLAFTNTRHVEIFLKRLGELIIDISKCTPIILTLFDKLAKDECVNFCFTKTLYNFTIESANLKGEYRYLTALRHVFANNTCSVLQIETIFLSNSFLRDLNCHFEIIRVIFELTKKIHNELISVPKIIYANSNQFLKLMKRKYKETGKNIFLYLALNMPFSLQLINSSFPNFCFFVLEAMKLVNLNEMDENNYNSIECTEISINKCHEKSKCDIEDLGHGQNMVSNCGLDPCRYKRDNNICSGVYCDEIKKDQVCKSYCINDTHSIHCDKIQTSEYKKHKLHSEIESIYVDAYMLFENSLDYVSENIVEKVDWYIADGLVKHLILHSEFSSMCLCAIQIIGKLPFHFKKFLQEPNRIVEFFEPPQKMYLWTGNHKLSFEKIINCAIEIGMGKLLPDLEANDLFVDRRINSFRKPMNICRSGKLKDAAVNVLKGLLCNVTGWNEFENDDVFKKYCALFSNLNLNSSFKCKDYDRQYYLSMLSNVPPSDFFQFTNLLYDSLACLFIFNEVHFLSCLYQIIAVYTCFDNLKNNESRHTFFCDNGFLLDALCESFMYVDASYGWESENINCIKVGSCDCTDNSLKSHDKEIRNLQHIEKSKVIAKDDLSGMDTYKNSCVKCSSKHVSLCNIKYQNINCMDKTNKKNKSISNVVLESLFFLSTDIDFNTNILINSGLFENILNRIIKLGAHDNSNKQLAYINGLYSLLEISKNNMEELIVKNISTITESLILYLSQDNPVYKYTANCILLHLVSLCNSHNISQFYNKESIGRVNGTNMIKIDDMITQLFVSLSSRYVDLRIISLNVLRCFADTSGIQLTELFSDLNEEYCCRLINYTRYEFYDDRIGVYDLILFLSRLDSLDHNHGLPFASKLRDIIKIDSGIELDPCSMMIRARLFFHILEFEETVDVLNEALLFLEKCLISPLCEDDEFLDYFGRKIASVCNNNMLKIYCTSLEKKYFEKPKLERIDILNNLDFFRAITYVFQLNIPEKIISFCFSYLVSDTDENVHIRLIRLISLYPALNSFQNQTMALLLMHYSNYKYLIEILIKHSFFLNQFVTRIRDTNVFYRIKQIIKHPKVMAYYRARIDDYVRMAKDIDNNNIINISLFVHYLQYKFTSEDLQQIIAKFDLLQIEEFTELIDACVEVVDIDYLFEKIPSFLFYRNTIFKIWKNYTGYNSNTIVCINRNLFFYGSDVYLEGDDFVYRLLVSNRVGNKLYVKERSVIDENKKIFNVEMINNKTELINKQYKKENSNEEKTYLNHADNGNLFEKVYSHLKTKKLDSMGLSYDKFLGVYEREDVYFVTHPFILYDLGKFDFILEECLKSISFQNKSFGVRYFEYNFDNFKFNEQLVHIYLQTVIDYDLELNQVLFDHDFIKTAFKIRIEVKNKSRLILYLSKIIDLGIELPIEYVNIIVENLNDENYDVNFDSLILQSDLAFIISRLNEKEHPLVAYKILSLVKDRFDISNSIMKLMNRIKNMNNYEVVEYASRLKKLNLEVKSKKNNGRFNAANKKQLKHAYNHDCKGEEMEFIRSEFKCFLSYEVQIPVFFKLAIFVDSVKSYKMLFKIIDVDNVKYFEFSGSKNNFQFIYDIYNDQRHSQLYYKLYDYFLEGMKCKDDIIRYKFQTYLYSKLPAEIEDRIHALLRMDWKGYGNYVVYTFLGALLFEKHFDLDVVKIYIFKFNEKRAESGAKTSALNTAIIQMCEILKKNITSCKIADLKTSILNLCYVDTDAALLLLCSYFSSIPNLSSYCESLSIFTEYIKDKKIVSVLLDVFGCYCFKSRQISNAYYAGFESLPLKEKLEILRTTNNFELYCIYAIESIKGLEETKNKQHSIVESLLYKTKVYTNASNPFICILNDRFEEADEYFTKNNDKKIKYPWIELLKRMCKWNMIYEIACFYEDAELEAEAYFITRGFDLELQNIALNLNPINAYFYEHGPDPDSFDLDYFYETVAKALCNEPRYGRERNKLYLKCQTAYELSTICSSNIDSFKWNEHTPLDLLDAPFYISFLLFLYNSSYYSLTNHIAKFIYSCATKSKDNYDAASFFNLRFLYLTKFNELVAFLKVKAELEFLDNRKIEDKSSNTEIDKKINKKTLTDSSSNIEYFADKNSSDSVEKRLAIVNLSIFNAEQKSILLGYVKSNLVKCVKLYNKNSELYYRLGKYLESIGGSIESIVESYLNSVIYGNVAFKSFVCILNYFDFPVSVRLLDRYIDYIDYKVLFDYLNHFLVNYRSECSERCILKLYEHVPRTITHFLVVTNDAKANEIGVAEEKNIGMDKFMDKIKNDHIYKNQQTITATFKRVIAVSNEQKAYDFLKSNFNVIILLITKRSQNSCLKDFICRTVQALTTMKCKPKIINHFIDDFTAMPTTTLEIALKMYKWMEIFESILRAHSSKITGFVPFHFDFARYSTVMFSHDEIYSDVTIDYFKPSLSLYITKRVVSKTLHLIGSDGKDYPFLTNFSELHTADIRTGIRVLTKLIERDFIANNFLGITPFNPDTTFPLTFDYDIFYISEPSIGFETILEKTMVESGKDQLRLFFDYIRFYEEISGDSVMNWSLYREYICNCGADNNQISKATEESSKFDNNNQINETVVESSKCGNNIEGINSRFDSNNQMNNDAGENIKCGNNIEGLNSKFDSNNQMNNDAGENIKCGNNIEGLNSKFDGNNQMNNDAGENIKFVNNIEEMNIKFANNNQMNETVVESSKFANYNQINETVVGNSVLNIKDNPNSQMTENVEEGGALKSRNNFKQFYDDNDVYYDEDGMDEIEKQANFEYNKNIREYVGKLEYDGAQIKTIKLEMSEDVRIRVYKKMCDFVGDQIFRNAMKSISDSNEVFMQIKKRLAKNHAILGFFTFLFDLKMDVLPDVAIKCYTYAILQIKLCPYGRVCHEDVRLTQNLQAFYGKEYIYGVFVPIANKFKNFLKKDDFFFDYVESIFGKRNTGDKLKNLCVETVVEHSMEAKQLSNHFFNYYAWF